MGRYIVIRRDTVAELEQAVNSYAQQKGYEPRGGIYGAVTNTDPTEILWCQAMWQPEIVDG